MDEPHLRDPRYHDIGSRVALAGHPIHAMLVSFPIALVMATAGSDFFFWWTADPFWIRAALWSSGFAFWLGIAAGIAGTVEILLAPGIRRRPASWTHFVAAMMLLAIAGANWGFRLAEPLASPLPWGAALSGLCVVFVAIAGWHGGKLVFEHQIGLILEGRD
ncbi:hypothetical protein STAQ_42600 [Allostella sp. ATCC 35155]|nr:hypothetical protein STAQ_42600 [Stella sp. ATCC 35155]